MEGDRRRWREGMEERETEEDGKKIGVTER